MDFKERYFSIWSQAWQFHKKFYNNNGSTQTWEQIVDESSELVKKYKDKPGHEFMKDLILATLNELERRDKINRKEHGEIG